MSSEPLAPPAFGQMGGNAFGALGWVKRMVLFGAMCPPPPPPKPTTNVPKTCPGGQDYMRYGECLYDTTDSVLFDELLAF